MTDKKQQRSEGYKARDTQIDKDKLSEIICHKFITHPSYLEADTIMWYLHCRSEVRTIDVLKKELEGPKKVVIPFCTKDKNQQNKLGLWLLDDLSELVPGTWGILEPPKKCWGDKEKIILPRDLDLIMVPGVAFDCQGGRIGNGGGYYDRLLQDVRVDTLLMAVCYESQMCNKVSMEHHDIVMDAVITEKNIYYNNS